MDDSDLPLFVLPMVLLPGEIQELRVFEPRYRQMLDTCILDERPFGLVLNDAFNPVNGWDGPRQIGCEATIISHETRGMNHFITILGGRRFCIEELIAPALPPLHDERLRDLIADGIYPDLQTLLERVPADVGHERLYISAKVRFLENEEKMSEQDQTLLRHLLSNLFEQAGQDLNIEQDTLQQWLIGVMDDNIDERMASIYNVAALAINDLETRQNILASATVEEAMYELQIWQSSQHDDEE